MLQIDQYAFQGSSHSSNIPNNERSRKQHEGQYYLTTLGKLQDRNHCYRDAEQNDVVYERQARVCHVDDAPVKTLVGPVRCLLEGKQSAYFPEVVHGTPAQSHERTQT